MPQCVKKKIGSHAHSTVMLQLKFKQQLIFVRGMTRNDNVHVIIFQCDHWTHFDSVPQMIKTKINLLTDHS